MKLYEISDKYLEFMELCESGLMPEEAAKDTLELIDSEFKKKADNIACLIKNSIAESKAIKEEAGNLYKRVLSKEKIIEYLKNYLKNQMMITNQSSIETTRNKITIRKNPECVELDSDFVNWAQVHADHFLKYKNPVPDKTAIKEILKSGHEVPHAILTKTERIDIK